MAFTFGGGIRTILSLSDESQFVWRNLLQAVMDHGGEVDALERLLKNTRKDRSLLDQFAKMVVGRIWEVKERMVDLGAIDFTCEFEAFQARYKKVQILPGGVYDNESLWTSTLPSRKCQYTLVHFSKPMVFGNIIKAQWGPCVEPANWRELVAYVAKLHPNDFSECDILALGSARTSGVLFPRASVHNGKVTLHWLGSKRPKEDKLGAKCFYLVRVYDTVG